MAKITIIGWYGTETIGDRAILAGIIKILVKAFGDISIKLGSIYPVLSERTLFDDNTFFRKCAGEYKFKISLFESANKKELEQTIKKTDLLLVGGGPLMNISQMYMLNYAFCFAKRMKVKTAICGCGWGPLNGNEYIKLTLNILKHSNIILFRDKTSVRLYEDQVGCRDNAWGIIDPAFFAVQTFLENNKRKESNTICVNYREILSDIQGTFATNIEEQLIKLTQNLSSNFSDSLIKLIPMHTFLIGGDDRLLLNRISKRINKKNIFVQNVPLTLEETMIAYQNARFCIGMRFHAILIQTLVNGNNFILDYTDAQNGKIINLLNQLNAFDLYSSRYVSLQSKEEIAFDFNKKTTQTFSIDYESIKNQFNLYVEKIKELNI